MKLLKLCAALGVTLMVGACGVQLLDIKATKATPGCEWVQSVYFSEAGIEALRLGEKVRVVEKDGELVLVQQTADGARQIRADRKKLGDHNQLYEKNCPPVKK